MARVRVAVIMGGRSSEHDISVASARSVVDALDPERYDVRAVEIGQDGRWQLEPAAEPGRIGVFLVFGGIFWSMVVDWWIIEAGFVVGVAISVLATVVYVRAALGRPAQVPVQPSSST